VGVVDVCVPPDVSGVCGVCGVSVVGVCVAGVDVPVTDDAGVCVPPAPAPAPGGVRFCGSLGVGVAAAADIYYYCYIIYYL
jgi:hypothetical protein